MEVAPGVLWDNLNEFAANQENGWTVSKIEGKGFNIKSAPKEGEDLLNVNIKLYGTIPEGKDEQEMFRKTVRFNKKSGDMILWRDQFNDLKSHLENILL
jgi:hypothetical protein